MPIQTLPSSAEAYTTSQRREIAAALLSVRRLWRRVGDDFEPGFAAVLPNLLAVTDTAQLRVARGAVGYIPDVLEETGQSRYLSARAGDVVPEAFVGVDGSGRPTDGLLYGGVVRARTAVAEGATTAQALTSAGAFLATAVGTLLSDTGRAAEVVGMATHRVGGYVRMLVPPSCSRCAVLAGAWYADSVAFQRHPGCDCRHIPASEGVGSELTVDSRAYFDSLSPEDQNKIFTNAGAEAIREGADVNQVVNARRGMKKAQIGGREVLTTSEGTTRRGFAYQYLSPSRETDVRGSITRFGESRRTRYMQANRPRMMPETLKAVSTDREDFIRLLRANGFLR